MKENLDWEKWMKETLGSEEVIFKESDWESAHKLLDSAQPQPAATFWKKRGGLLLTMLFSMAIIIGFLIYLALKQNPEQTKQKDSHKITYQPNTPEIEDMAKNHKKPSETSLLGQDHSDIGTINPEPAQKQKKNPDKSPPFTKTKQSDNIVRNDVSSQRKIPPNTDIPNTPANETKLNQNPEYSSRIEKNSTRFTPENVANNPSNIGELMMDKSESPEDKHYQASALNAKYEKKEIFTQSKKTESEIISLTSTPQSLSNPSKEQVFIPITPEKVKGRRMSLFVFAGMSVQEKSYAVSPLLGVGYRYKTHLGIGLQSGINYSIFRNPIGLVQQVNQIQYGLGFEQTTYVLTTKALHFAELSFGAVFPLGKRQELSGNIHYGRLFYSAATLEVKQQDSFGQKGATSSNVSGYIQGIRVSDIGASVGYSFYINRKIQFNTSIFTGFRDLTRNEVWGNGTFHRNTQWRTGLIFRL